MFCAALLALSGCKEPEISKELRQAVELVQKNTQAEKIQIAEQPTQHGQVFELTLVDPANLGQNLDDQSEGISASSCAVLLFENLPPAQRKAWAKVNVKLVRKGKQKLYSFETLDLEQFNRAKPVISNFIDAFNAADSSSLVNICSAELREDAGDQAIANLMQERYSALGQLQDWQLSGFEITEVEPDQRKAIEVFILATTKEGPTPMVLMFYRGTDSASLKVSGLHF